MLEAMRKGSDDAACYLYDTLTPKVEPDVRAEVVEALSSSAEAGHPESMLLMGIEMSQGSMTEDDMDKAAEYLRTAYRSRVPGAEVPLQDILWTINTEESLSELDELSYELASKGDSQAAMWLARVILKGKHTGHRVKDVEPFLRDAVSSKVPGARILLMRILWMQGTKESCEEMVKLARPLLAKKHDRALILVGKAYLYGKGVEKDPSKALKMFEEAEAKNPALKKELEPLYRKARASKDKQSM